MQSNPPPKSRSYSMASQSSGSSPMSVRRPSQNPTSLFGWSQIQKSSSMYSSKRSLLPDHLNEAREVLQIHLLFMLLQVSTILTFGSTGGPPPFLWCDVTRLTAHVLTQLLHISNLCHSPALTQWGQSLRHTECESDSHLGAIMRAKKVLKKRHIHPIWNYLHTIRQNEERILS